MAIFSDETEEAKWLQELELMLARKKRERELAGLTEPDWHKIQAKFPHEASVDMVLDYVRYAVNHPEFWPEFKRRIEEEKEMIRKGDEYLANEMRKQRAWFSGKFRSWYLMSHELDISQFPFRGAQRVFIEIVNGTIKSTESEEARQLLLEHPSVFEPN